MLPELAALLNSAMILVIGLARMGNAGFISPKAGRMMVAAFGAFVIQWDLTHPDDSVHSWVKPAVHTLLVFGGLANLLAENQLSRRQRRYPSLDPDRAVDSHGQGLQLLRRFDRSGDVAALSRGIDSLRTALEASPGETTRTQYAANLVMALRGRYQRLRNVADLDEAVDVGRRTARGEPADDVRRAALLSQLGSALRVRYDHFGDRADLEEALATARKAVEIVPVRFGADRLLCLRELSAVLRSRYERTRGSADLDEAIETLGTVLLITESGDRPFVRVMDLTTVCFLLVQRFERTRRPSDLDRALDLGRQAAERVPRNSRLYTTCQNNFALALRTRYEHTQDAATLEEAIDLARRAVGATAEDDPERAVHLVNLARALHHRYRRTGDHAELAQACALAREATADPATDLPTRVVAGLVWSDLAAAAERYADAVRAFEGVIELLPQLASRELRRADQEYRLGQWTGIAVTAAACAIAAGQPEKAVTLLERGRGVLLSRALGVRPDLSALRGRNPALADEFTELRTMLEGFHEPLELETDTPGIRREQERKERRALIARWDSLLDRIRQEKGLADFAREPTLREMLAQTREGPLVFLNVSEQRSDAVILDAEGVRTLELTGVTPGLVTEQTAVMLDAVRPEAMLDQGEQERFAGVLAWLWDALVEPVVNVLDLSRRGDDWPRVWWVPTGPLAMMPIHAAGHHGAGDRTDPPALLDRAISSYAPTLRTLVDARARRRPAGKPRPLAVAMSTTAGEAPLKHARAEADELRRLFPTTRVLADHKADSTTVLAELPRRTWAHFACHAVTDVESPSRGHLLLHDHRRRPLSVADVSRLDLRRADLAYLSCCDTARPDTRLNDEAIHLASSFQIAGFAHVIAALWPLRDRVALEFAVQIYQGLHGSARNGRRTDAAAAVHHATRRAREMYPNFPALWAGHIHVGP
ncbi:CHAT domain-containing protein [Actinomadura sp. NAK00032]|uniref:CHAT domain-containing protein n=1 Tax=Actinomadura sp. NAK00032 TaxID=2742128 RepID=UPI00158FD03F|nr:CHAT domain-containing protein [Actinomadura sp. NAK00032]QKW33259.1 CHAT domain-containing protein [Actinomadura sp. NAK00032]